MRGCSILIVSLVFSSLVAAQPDLSSELAKLDGQVILRGSNRESPLAGMLANDARAGLRLANQRERDAWAKVASKADWEKFRDLRLAALRKALGQYPPPPADLKVRVTGSHQGDGYRVDNLVYESRPGLLVTANLYRPTPPAKSMPGIIVVHSHQQPKHVGIRQDMGMTWARAGCLVLIPDHLGHGERRQHPFATEKDYAKPFPARQDYYHRYDLGMQLDLIGDSLMGWLVWDLARGVDVLLAQPGIDAQRIILISEPAGGGDVAAVAAALDARIAGAVVNNFGGPEPESPYPLPRDAEQSFDYAGSGSWEPTRNLRLSARDGFLPWVILAGLAPRKLVYLHEFYWDQETDPAWKRLQKAHGLQNAGASLAGLAGYGFVVGTAPQNSHWIPRNRELLYPLLQQYFQIADPKKEYSERLPEDQLLCLKPDMKSTPLHELASQLGRDRAVEARQRHIKRAPVDKLRQEWRDLLGDVTARNPVVRMVEIDEPGLPGVRVERIHLATEPGIVVPVLLLTPAAKVRRPVMVGVAQAGKQEFLKQRSNDIAELLKTGHAVCLVDVRGTGETSPGGSRDRSGPIASISSSQLMLGRPLLGGRIRDLLGVLRYLRQRDDIDVTRIALWGDSFTPPNPADTNLVVPHGVDGRPTLAEPLGGLLVLLTALLDEKIFGESIAAIYVHGGLVSYQSALAGPFVYLPHDTIVPGVLTVGDLPEVASKLDPRPLRLACMVDAGNRRVGAATLKQLYPGAVLDGEDSPARWLADQLKK